MYPRSWVPDKVQRVLWYTYVGISDKERRVLWYTYVGISDKERRVLWYTHVRNIAVLARFNHCTHGQTCTRVPLKIQIFASTKLAVAAAVALSRDRCTYNLKKATNPGE